MVVRLVLVFMVVRGAGDHLTGRVGRVRVVFGVLVELGVVHDPLCNLGEHFLNT